MGRKPLPSSVATASSPLLPLLHHAERKGECRHLHRCTTPEIEFAAQTAVNHNRHHGYRESFAGDRRSCEMPPQPTLAVIAPPDQPLLLADDATVLLR
nr:hypothetical protein Iba_chr05eCG9500 [Ipomoea batatas]